MQSNSSSVRNVIVTGANKGIGYAVIDSLMAGSVPYNIVLTSRDEKRGEEAAAKLKEKHKDSKCSLRVEQLDVIDSASVKHFLDRIVASLKTIDVLVNNAGINIKNADIQQKLDVLNTNFLSTVSLTEQILPHLAKDGKIIMVSSRAGLLSSQGAAVQEILKDSTLDEKRLMDLSGKLYEHYELGNNNELGFSNDSYSDSKVLLNAYTRWVLKPKLAGDQQCFAMTPGHCRTDMGGDKAPRSAEEGVGTVIYLVNLPFKRNDDLNGQFIGDRQVIDF